MSIFSPWPIRRCLSHPEHLRCSRRTVYANGSRPQATSDIKDDVKKIEETTLPPLNRPLGVRQRPTTGTKAAGQILKDLMDPVTRMEQRRHLYVTLRCLTTIFQIDL
jgi:ATPase complex subunit ATP10